MKIKNGMLLQVDNSDIKNGEFVFPVDVVLIHDHAFKNCSDLTSITIPEHVIASDSPAFSYCLNLTRLVVRQDTTLIEDEASFEGDFSPGFSLPQSVSSICAAFRGCTKLSVLHTDANSQNSYERIFYSLPLDIQAQIVKGYGVLLTKYTDVISKLRVSCRFF